MRDGGEASGTSGGVIGRMLASLVLSQIAMAASAAGLVFACSRVLDRPISAWWFAAAFLSAWCVYLRDSAASCDAEDAISQPRRAAIFRGRRFWSWWLPGIAAVLGAGAALAAGPRTLTMALLAVMSVVAGLHARRGDATGTAGLSVKRLAAIKSIVVSLAWSLAAVGLPLLESATEPDRAAIVAGVWLVMLTTPVLLADSLLLDLRDRAADQAFGLHTIAVRVGRRGVHALVAILLAIAAVVAILGVPDAIDHERWRRVATAAVLGLAVPWFGWRTIRRDEVATAFTIMAWRLLAALAVL